MFFIFTPKIGEDSQFDEYFSNGLKPPTRLYTQELRVRVWMVGASWIMFGS